MGGRAVGLGVGNIGPVSVGADGTIYVAGLVDVPGPLTTEAVFALNPDGSQKWVFDDTGTEQIIAGPNVGPDGNIYAVMEGVDGIGFFSLTPAGNLRFAVDSGEFDDYGSLGEEIVFSHDTAYFAFENSIGLFAYRLDGNRRWAANLARHRRLRAGDRTQRQRRRPRRRDRRVEPASVQAFRRARLAVHRAVRECPRQARCRTGQHRVRVAEPEQPRRAQSERCAQVAAHEQRHLLRPGGQPHELDDLHGRSGHLR